MVPKNRCEKSVSCNAFRTQQRTDCTRARATWIQMTFARHCVRFFPSRPPSKRSETRLNSSHGIRDESVTGVQTCALPIQAPSRILRRGDGGADVGLGVGA